MTRRWLPALAWAHPVTVLMLFLALLVVGVIGYVRIPVQMMPDGFEPHFLWVRVPLPNATPAESDERVVRPIEAELSTLAGLEKLDSRASSDGASFSLEFHASVPMSEAYNDTLDRLERAMPQLPKEVERAWIFKYSPTDEPVVWTGVTFPDEVDDPYRLLEKVVLPRLERVPGVASVDTWGVNARRVFVDYDRDRMMAEGVDIGDVQRRLATDNFQMSGGRLVDRGEVRHVRSLARIADLPTLERWPIRGDGIVLGDIATVELRGVADAAINRVDGRQAGALGLRKESSANTAEVSAAVREAIAELEADPRARGARFHVFFDQGELIDKSLGTLGRATIEGGLLSVVVLWLFLREARMTLLISLSIPFSLLITIAWMYFTGASLDIIAMMGLLLAVGMVVDNAIVVVEGIYRLRSKGMPLQEAAIEGTAEVGLAILASTATTMVVFLPVMVMTEDADAAFFLRVLGLPVIVSIAASLLVAIVFAPLATRLVGHVDVRPDAAWLVRLQSAYDRLLEKVLTRRADTLMTMLAGLLLTVGVAVRGVQCVPGDENGMNDFMVRMHVPPDATPPERDAIAKVYEGWVDEHRAAWGVRVTRVNVDSRGSRGRLWVYLEEDGPMSREDVVEAARASLPQDVPGVRAEIGWGEGSDGGSRITLALYGEDMDVLGGLADEVVRRVGGLEGVLGADRGDVGDALDEIRLRPDPGALERYGVSAESLAGTVAFAMRGSQLPDLGDGLAAVDVETRVALEDRSDVNTLLDFPVWSQATGSAVPVRALAGMEVGHAPGDIQRTDRRTSVSVSLDLAEDVDRDALMGALQVALDDMELPRGYSWDAGGWKQDQAQENDALFFAFFMSVVFVFLLMGVLFESWLLPLAVVTTVPMALVGAWWSLWITDTGMDTMAGIGLVVLVGVVVNHGVVLVDAIGQLHVPGTDRLAAVHEACRRRFRPVLMTALCTIVGLVPMAAGSEDFVGMPYAALGRTIIGGMIASTVLMLLFVPFLYVMLDDLRVWAAKGWRYTWG